MVSPFGLFIRKRTRMNLMRFLFLLAFITAHPLWSAIWPELLQQYQRISVESFSPAQDQELWTEYGLEAAERAVYRGNGKTFNVEAYRLTDPTAGYAVFEWLRPKDAVAIEDYVDLTTLAVKSSNSVLIGYGNYVFKFYNHEPEIIELQQLALTVPRLSYSPLPPFTSYMPRDNTLVPNSERFILGPTSLEKFFPHVPASVAAFHLGTEAEVATYKTASGQMVLALFSYPTPQIAREQAEAFRAIGGLVVKRTGPLVAVVPSPRDPDEAERLLAKVNYRATISWNEPVDKGEELTLGKLILIIFTLVGILVGLALLGGLAVFGMRMLVRRVTGAPENEDPMIMLHLDQRS